MWPAVWARRRPGVSRSQAVASSLPLAAALAGQMQRPAVGRPSFAPSGSWPTPSARRGAVHSCHVDCGVRACVLDPHSCSSRESRRRSGVLATYHLARSAQHAEDVMARATSPHVPTMQTHRALVFLCFLQGVASPAANLQD